MQGSLSKLVDNLSDIINNKELENKFIDNTRFVTDSLSQIDRKISQIGKKELKNKFIYNMRFKMISLLQCINKILQIDKKELKIYIYR